MPAIQHFAAASTRCDVTATPTAGVVTYFLNGAQHPGPNISFNFGPSPGDVQHLSIMFTAPDGSTCPVVLRFGNQVDHDFLSSVAGAPPDIRDHDFITAASVADVSGAMRFRTLQLTGRMPAAKPAKKKKARRTRRKGTGHDASTATVDGADYCSFSVGRRPAIN
ncbi:MAG: hypothetical protein FJW31_13685 [Acidobacteria bacterium]|nr:hypothetical protein [Acidobacteriota bacterium]